MGAAQRQAWKSRFPPSLGKEITAPERVAERKKDRRDGLPRMECIQCKTTWDDHKNMVASISLERMGDEHSYTYWLCPDCDVYTEM